MNVPDTNPPRKIELVSHIEELKSSGLTSETWESAGLYSEMDNAKIASLLNRKTVRSDLGAALVFPYFDLNGKPTGYSRIKPTNPRIDQKTDRRVKYEAPYAKPPQAYFPLFARESILKSERLIITEGEKKTLCACQHGFPAIGLSGVWSWKVKKAGLLPELQAFPWQGRRVVIVFDSDRVGNISIQKSELSLSAQLTRLGAIVTVVTLLPGPNGSKTGIDDYFVRGGSDADFAIILESGSPAAEVSSCDDGKPKLPEIIVDFDEHRVNNEAIALLANDPETFCRGGVLCRVIYDPSENLIDNIVTRMEPKIEAMTAPTLSERLSTVAKWIEDVASLEDKAQGEMKIRQIHPPKKVIDAILDRRIWPEVKRLTALVSFPVVLSDGSILTTLGYHSETGLYYSPQKPVELTVKEFPDQDDARRAVGELSEVICDFPFAEEHHRAAWFAALLTPIARFAFEGFSPLFLIEANKAGSGKGLLADCISLIVQGSPMHVTTMPKEGEEFRKRITAILMAGKPFSLIDNVQDRIGTGELDAVITSWTWSDRILGVSKTADLTNLVTWLATGNNLEVVGDTMRRICPIKFITQEERPEERCAFKHKKLREWVVSQRPRLLSAALTILKAYIGSKRPNMGLPSWGSFEGWSDLVRGAIVWSGLPDPFDGRQSLQEDSVEESKVAIQSLMESWEQLDPSGDGLTTSQIVSTIESSYLDRELTDMLLILTNGCQTEKRSNVLGCQMRRYKNQWIRGLRIVKKGIYRGQTRWIVQKTTSMQSPAGGDSPADMTTPIPTVENEIQTKDRIFEKRFSEMKGLEAMKG